MNKTYHSIQTHESIKVDAKNKTIEANGLLAVIVVIGGFILIGAYIYGKFFHVKVVTKVRRYHVKRKARKSNKKK